MPLKEQTSGLGTRQHIQRKSLVAPPQPASRHRVGHYAGLHPEDTPYLTGQHPIPQRYTIQNAHQRIPAPAYDTNEDDEVYADRPPRSALRYTPISPDRQLAPYHEPQREKRPHAHPLVFVGIAIFIMVVGWITISALGTWVQQKQDDWKYGNPRTFQIDANVGHGTAQTPNSHFIALNLHGEILVVELPAGDASHARIYPITTLQEGTEDTPVTLSFKDINLDGKPDLLVQIGDPSTMYTLILFNNGSQFVSKL